LDQEVIIENIAGGSGVVGSQEALNENNDGYTLLAIHESLSMSELTGQADFGVNDFEPVALMTSTYKAVATNKDSSWDDMEDLGRCKRKSRRDNFFSIYRLYFSTGTCDATNSFRHRI